MKKEDEILNEEINDLNEQSDAEITSDEEVDNFKNAEYFLGKIKAKFWATGFGGFFVSVIGLIVLIVYQRDWSLGALIGLMGLLLIWIGYLKYGSKKEDNIKIIEAECVEKHRSGYRKQYFEYTFKIDEKRSFSIETATKEKFKKGIWYYMCINKKDYDKSHITGTSLIYHETK